MGFSRLEPVLPNIHGEDAADVARAPLAREASWFPAVENRGERLFVQLEPGAVEGWMERAGVRRRIQALREGHERHYGERRVPRVPEFPDGPYLLLHTLSHLLIQSVSLRCGYPASSLREHIYVQGPSRRYGIRLFKASPDAKGTLGGLVQQARRLGEHLAFARRAAALCSNDPICAGHEPLDTHQHRWLHGAACHGCLLISETSGAMRNEYLGRALLVPVMGLEDAASFAAWP